MRVRNSGLLDHHIGKREELVRHRQAKRLSSVEVDDQFELSRLLDRQVGWFLAFEDAARIDAGPLTRIHNVRRVADQSADVRKLTRAIDRR